MPRLSACLPPEPDLNYKLILWRNSNLNFFPIPPRLRLKTARLWFMSLRFCCTRLFEAKKKSFRASGAGICLCCCWDFFFVFISSRNNRLATHRSEDDTRRISLIVRARTIANPRGDRKAVSRLTFGLALAVLDWTMIWLTWKVFCKFLHLLPSFQTGTNGTAAQSEGSDFSEDHDLPKINHKPFFRRLSFKALRKGKVIKMMVMMTNLNFTLPTIRSTDLLPFVPSRPSSHATTQVPFQTIFQKQSSEDFDLSSTDPNKKKLAKIVVECRKEGLVNYVPPEYLKNDNKDLTKLEWEKCKLVLVKCAGGYMLEFHSLDKTPKVSPVNFVHDRAVSQFSHFFRF